MAPRKAYAQPQAGSEGFARTKKVYGAASVPILATDVGTINNQVACFMVPKDFVVTGINAVIPALAASGLTLSIGDNGNAALGIAANPARLVSASAVGVGGGTVNAFAAGGQYYRYPTDTEILLTATAAGVTPAAGAITNFYLEGFIGP
jgi:hypothetical protein